MGFAIKTKELIYMTEKKQQGKKVEGEQLKPVKVGWDLCIPAMQSVGDLPQLSMQKRWTVVDGDKEIVNEVCISAKGWTSFAVTEHFLHALEEVKKLDLETSTSRVNQNWRMKKLK